MNVKCIIGRGRRFWGRGGARRGTRGSLTSLSADTSSWEEEEEEEKEEEEEVLTWTPRDANRPRQNRLRGFKSYMDSAYRNK